MKLKLKAVLGLMLVLSLVVISTFSVPPGSAQETVDIGILGPVGWTVGDGMLEGAILAAEQVNLAGILPDGATINILDMADTLRGRPDPDPETGTLAMTELLVAGADFAIGCFRSESAFGARVVAADNELIFYITGAATDALIDDGPGGATDTLREDYPRWKYVFRNTPMNSTTLVRSLCGLYPYGIIGFIERILEEKLVKIYGNYLWGGNHPIYGVPVPQVKTAVIAEEPIWATGIYNALVYQPYSSYLLGPYANVTYSTRISAVATDVSGVLGEAVATGVRLIIHIISGPVGRVFTNQWITEIPEEDRPIIIGINVPGQDQPDHWTETAGRAEYEAFLSTTGTRTPANTEGPNLTTDFWDDYCARWGRAPVYTAYGVYDTVWGIAENIAAFGHWPPTDPGDYDLLIPIIEQTDRHGIVGWFKYTGPHPGPGYEFGAQNPTMTGGLHDFWTIDIGVDTTPPGYVRAVIGQWQGPAAPNPYFPGNPVTGTLEICCPEDKPYSRRFRLPPWYYRLDGVDMNYDGTVDIYDAITLAGAFGSYPGHPRWNIDNDIVVDGIIDIYDAITLAGAFGESEPIPYPDP